MAEYNIGSSGGDFQDTVRRAQAAASSMDELNRKERQRQNTEERTAAKEGESARTRTGLAGATTDLTSALERNAAQLNVETSALERNIAMMQRSLQLRREMAGVGAPLVAPVSSATNIAEAQAVNARLQAETQRIAAAQQTAYRSIVGPTPGVRYYAGTEGAAYRREQLQLPAGGSYLLPPGSMAPGSDRGAQPWQQQVQRTFAMPAGAGYYGTTTGGAASPTHLGNQTEELTRYRAAVEENYAALDRLSVTQREANLAFNEAGAIYANSSQALSRHGALTTEFIQAFARGQVTLKEFESQMLSTIGKFGGWAIAGGAVYGVFRLFEDLKNGAVETQAAVLQLGRFIPGLGGPAGGGTGRVAAAQATVRDISTQFNVPIKEVVDNMTVMARVFHDVASAGDATRAVLAVSRLDQVSPQQAQQYLIGIAQSQGFTQGSQLIGVVNSLNALQATYGARVSQTLPAVARAAPAAFAAGTDLHTLEGLAAIGVRAGLPGNQVGTALLRSMGTFAFRPTSQLAFREFGITPEIGNYGGLIRQVMSLIDTREKQGRPLGGPQLIRLAQALGGPLLGSRSILPLLTAEELRPGSFASAVGTARHPRSYQEDLDAVLGTITERFKSIGIALQSFGGMLAQAGLLTPLTAMLDVFSTLVHVTQALLSPLTELGNIVKELPAPLRDAVGALVAFRVARGLYNTTFGSAAQSFVGRLPGLSAVRSLPREAVEGTQARLETYLIPNARNDAEAASRRLLAARANVRSAVADLNLYQAQNAGAIYGPEGAPATRAAQAGVAERLATLQTAQGAVGPAEQRVAEATAQLAELTSDLVISKDKQYSYADRTAYLEQQGYIAQQETVNVQEQVLAAKRAQIGALRGGGGGGVAAAEGGAMAGMDAAALAAGAGVAASAAATALAKDPAALGDLQKGVAATGLAVPPSVRGGYGATQAPAQTVAAVAAMNAQRAQAMREASWTGATGLGVIDRMQGMSNAVTDRMAAFTGATGMMPLAMMQNAAERTRGFLSGPGLPIAGLIGTQMLGGAVGGGIGNYISSVGGSAFGGMMLMQMLGKGNPALGFAAGQLLGNIQNGTGAGSGIGTVAGGIIGGLFGGAPGAFLGAGIGGTAGGLLQQIFGGGPHQQSAADIQNVGTLQAIRRLQNAAVGNAQQDKFGNQTTDDLTSAFLGSGNSQQAASARVNAIMKNLTGTLQLFGTDSPQGKAASQSMTQVMGAALALATVDPGDAQQVIQTVTQSRNAEVQRRLQYNIATGSGPNSGQAAAIQAATQYQEIANPVLDAASNAQQAAADAQEQLAQLQTRAASATGKQRDQLDRQVQAARKNVSQTNSIASAAKSAAKYAQENATLQAQAAAQAGYQADVQDIQARGTLTQAQAGGNAMGQLRAQLGVARQTLARAQGDKHLDPRTQLDEMLKARAQIIDAQNKMATQGLTELQSTGQITLAKTPIGRPDIQSKAKLEDLRRQYQYVSEHKKAFDPSQINNLLAEVIQAEKDASDAAAQYAIQMSDLHTRIQQSQDFGNAIAQASDAIAGAVRDMRAAVTPAEKQQAYGQYLDAVNQRYQATQETIKSQGALQAALAQGDPLAVAEVNVRTAQQLRAGARGADNIRQAETDLVSAEYALSQARIQRIQTIAQVQEAQSQSNPVRSAQIAVAAARAEMVNAHGWSQQMQAEKDLADAQYQLAQARLSSSEGTIDFQFQMMKISSGQAIQQLQNLLRMSNITKAQRQQLQEQIRRYQLGLEQPIGAQGSFNLAPGNIRLPTYYDVSRALRGGRPAANATAMAIQNATQVNVYVRHAGDVPKVADAIDRATSTNLRGRLRAAGVR